MQHCVITAQCQRRSPAPRYVLSLTGAESSFSSRDLASIFCATTSRQNSSSTVRVRQGERERGRAEDLVRCSETDQQAREEARAHRKPNCV